MKKKMSKILSVLLGVLVMIGIIPIEAFAETESYFSYSVTDGEAMITDVDSLIGSEITIPSTLGGYPVTSIDNYAFQNCNNLTSITFPNTLTHIERYAFTGQGVLQIKKVYIDNITSWLNIEFDYDWLKGTYPNPLQYGADLYIENQLVEELVIPQGTKAINGAAFVGCASIKKVVLPEGIEEIGDSVFYDCINLKEINIPSSVNYIGLHAFASCSNINVYASDIDSWLNIEYGWGSSDFGHECNPLFRGGKLYFGNQLVEHLVIPANRSTIPALSFEGCSSITSIFIPKNVTEIHSEAFAGVSILENVYYEGTKEEWDQVYIGYANNAITEAEITYNYKPIFSDSSNAKIVGNALVMNAGITVEQLLMQAGNDAVVKDSRGNVLTSDKLPGTGMVLVLPDGKEHTIVVLGDVEGDGIVSASDARLALRASVGLEDYTEDSVQYKAAKVGTGDALSAADARLILRASVGLEEPKNWMP